MNITRNNYEEFFMLYADDELTAAQKSEVEAFVTVNIDLQQELILFQQFKAKPDTAVVFDNKELLMNQNASGLTISTTNCESFFVLYADNELTHDEKTAIENFVYLHPQLMQTFEFFQQAKFTADTNVVFKNKEILYQEDEDDKVIPFRWWKMAAAAIILLATGLIWLNKEKKKDQPSVVSVAPVKQQSLQRRKETNTDTKNKNEQPAKETIASSEDVKQPVTNTLQIKNAAGIASKKEIRQNNSNFRLTQTVIPKEEVVINDANKLNNSSVQSKNEKPEDTGTEKPEAEKSVIVVAATKTLPDQPAIILYPDENEKANASFASFNTSNDNVEILNTSVNTKNSLRGFLRKATRLIAKKTNGGDDGGKNKNILIGGFEIAVR